MKFEYSNTSISEAQLLSTMQSLTDYVKIVKEGIDEFPIHTPFYNESIKAVEKIGEVCSKMSIKYVFVIGIGGSNLGTWAIYEALRGLFESTNKQYPKLLFVDTVSSSQIKEVQEFIEQNVGEEEFLINIISKSGGTTETISNASVIVNKLRSRLGEEIVNRIIITTDEGSKLWKYANKASFHKLAIPKHVGGRYSVFSPAGLFPILAANLDYESLLKGAREESEKSFSIDVSNNALVSASIQYLLYKSGYSISNHFFFCPSLEKVGKWYRQLMGESIGKKQDLDGNEVRAGITPIVSIGSTDLHSMAQLYYGGPKDKITTIISVKDQEDGVAEYVPQNGWFSNIVAGIEGKTFDEISNAILGGVIQAYKKNELPFMTIELEEINEYELGKFMQMKMFEIIYLAKLMNVNAFDQPSVEDYKEETRKILMNN